VRAVIHRSALAYSVLVVHATRCIRFFVRFGYDLIRRHSTFFEQYFGTKAMASNFLGPVLN
jgi:hypothetical protein